MNIKIILLPLISVVLIILGNFYQKHAHDYIGGSISRWEIILYMSTFVFLISTSHSAGHIAYDQLHIIFSWSILHMASYISYSAGPYYIWPVTYHIQLVHITYDQLHVTFSWSILHMTRTNQILSNNNGLFENSTNP